MAKRIRIEEFRYFMPWNVFRCLRLRLWPGLDDACSFPRFDLSCSLKKCAALAGKESFARRVNGIDMKRPHTCAYGFTAVVGD